MARAADHRGSQTPMQVSTSPTDSLGNMDAIETAEKIGVGEISAEQAISAAIERLRLVEPQLNAIVCERFEEALAQARALPPAKGQLPFSGVPCLIKDNTNLAGLPTRHGSRGTPAAAATSDDEITRCFLATGLIPIAKNRATGIWSHRNH